MCWVVSVRGMGTIWWPFVLTLLGQSGLHMRRSEARDRPRSEGCRGAALRPHLLQSRPRDLPGPLPHLVPSGLGTGSFLSGLLHTPWLQPSSSFSWPAGSGVGDLPSRRPWPGLAFAASTCSVPPPPLGFSQANQGRGLCASPPEAEKETIPSQTPRRVCGCHSPRWSCKLSAESVPCRPGRHLAGRRAPRGSVQTQVAPAPGGHAHHRESRGSCVERRRPAFSLPDPPSCPFCPPYPQGAPLPEGLCHRDSLACMAVTPSAPKAACFRASLKSSDPLELVL